MFSLTEQSRPVQRRSEEVIISGHVAALVRCQHLHHGLVTISHSKVQGGPTLVVLPVQQGLGGSCLLDVHNTADTVRRMKKRKEDKLCCVCVFVPEYSGRFVWRWALDCVQPSAAGSCPHCLGCQCWNRAWSGDERVLVGYKMLTSAERFAAAEKRRGRNRDKTARKLPSTDTMLTFIFIRFNQVWNRLERLRMKFNKTPVWDSLRPLSPDTVMLVRWLQNQPQLSDIQQNHQPVRRVCVSCGLISRTEYRAADC